LLAPVRRNERNSHDALKHFRFLAIRAVKGTKIKNANTGEALSGASTNSGSGVIRGYSYLKRAQQDCTDEREYRENCQYIEP
jgi:hypothetical protein